MDKIIKKLNKWSQLNAVASNEIEVIDHLKNILKVPYTQDRLGSVIATKGKGLNVLVSAPIDEVGMIVSQIKPNGLILFQNVGFMQSKNALNQLFTISSSKGNFIATLLSKPLSIQTKEELQKVDDFKQMYLDSGFNSDKEVYSKGIQIGDMITRYSPLQVFENERITSKALESRVPTYVLSELINNKDDLNVKLYAAFTVQHKMSMKGAKTSSYMVEPDIAISLDTIETTETGHDTQVKLGHGPVITFYDKGLIAHPKLRKLIIDLCKKENIKYQEAHQMNEMNEGHYLQLSKLGAATISIGIPIRNKNDHNQMVDLKDVAETKLLLETVVKALNEEVIHNILYN